MKIKIVHKDFYINKFIKESYDTYNALKNRTILTEAETHIDMNTVPNYLRNIATNFNKLFSDENINKINNQLNNIINRIELVTKVNTANEDLKKHYTRQASNLPEDLKVSMNEYFDTVADLIPQNNIELNKFIEKLRKDIFSSKKLSQFKDDTGELLQSKIFDVIEQAILGAVKLPKDIKDLSELTSLCEAAQQSLGELRTASEQFTKDNIFSNALEELANKIEADKDNENRTKSWQSKIVPILAGLKKLDQTAKLDLSANSLKLLKANIEEATKNLTSEQRKGTLKKIVKYNDNANKNHEKNIDKSIENDGNILDNESDDIGWAEKLKLATSSGDSKKDMEASNIFWEEYYKTEWKEKAKEVANLGNTFRNELIKLGFTKDTNPFIKFIEDNIDLLNINNYAAFHNAYINRYISKAMLNNSKENNIGHILSCKNLYSQTANDILKYLKYQHQILLKYDNNSLNFTEQRLTDLFGDKANENAFLYSIFVAKADPTSEQIVPSGLSAKIADPATPAEDKQRFVEAIVKKLNTEPLENKNIALISNIEAKLERCFGETEKKITVNNEQINKIGKELKNDLDIASGIKYLATLYNVPIETIMKYPKIAENKALDISKNKQLAAIFKPFEIKQSNVQSIITALAKEAGWEK